MPDEKNSAFVRDDNLYGKVPKMEPSPEKQIGIDTKDGFYKNIVLAAENNTLDMSSLDSFLTTSRSRDQVYSVIDNMSEDSTISAVLESYAEDSTEINENGDVMWAESSDPSIAKYINYLLKSMRVNKNMYGWVYSLCKYGDIYLRLYRESDYQRDTLFQEEQDKNVRNTLNEDFNNDYFDLDKHEVLEESVKVKAYSKNDHYVHYIEAMPNPAEMFELTKFGRSYAYIKSEINSQPSGIQDWYQGSEFMRYRFNRNDIRVYQATEFVHGYLEDNSSRIPEEISIEFTSSEDDDADTRTSTYKVRRGQSLLYDVFKTWRQLQLLENSVLLNRVTKSSIVRILGIEVGDMPKEMVGPHLQGIKSLIEQKSALELNTHMNEYTNPGPIENNIYVPMHNGVGNITMQTVGGDVNVGELTDLDYFRRKLFGALRVPPPDFSWTEDSAGFSGGESLSLISSKYAKMVIRIQNVMVQTITDAINLMLIDKGMQGYINKFNIKMKKPVTQDDVSRKDQMQGNLQTTSDTMSLISDIIEDNATKLKMIKSLITSYIPNPEFLGLIQEEIDKLEREKEETPQEEPSGEEGYFGGEMGEESEEPSGGGSMGLAGDLGLDIGGGPEEEMGEETGGGNEEEEALPSPSELGLDFTDSNQPDFQ